MTKKPSDMLLNVAIAIAVVLGLFVLGSWLLQVRSDSETDDVSAGKSIQISEVNLRPRC